jgi:hypothetical protein
MSATQTSFSISFYIDDRVGSLDPIGDEDVGVALFGRVAVRAEDGLLAVGQEHWEAVEGVVERYALKPRDIDIDRVKVEFSVALLLRRAIAGVINGMSPEFWDY